MAHHKAEGKDSESRPILMSFCLQSELFERLINCEPTNESMIHF